MLDPYLFLLAKATLEGVCDWVGAVVNSSLREEVDMLPLKETVLCFLFKGSSLDPVNLNS